MKRKRKFQLSLVAFFLSFSIAALVNLFGESEPSGNSNRIVSTFSETEAANLADSEAVVFNEQASENTAIAEVVQGLLDEYGTTPDQVSIVYYDLQNGNQYLLNEEAIFYAASTTKVAVAGIYIDLMEQGLLNWDSELPYYDSYYEEGNGEITNSEKRLAYPVDELIYQMLTYSDNTATNILEEYYTDTFGDYCTAVIKFSEIENPSSELYQGNYATGVLLAETLVKVAENDQYEAITDIMKEAQTGYRLKEYISEGVAAKYGSYDGWEHDIGIFYDGDAPEYVLVVLTNDMGDVDEFIGELSLQINKTRVNAS